MRGSGPLAIISVMTTPIRSSKILLIADRRQDAGQTGHAPVRRFRLARLPLQDRPAAPAARPRAV
ncbi:MAG: hypothetical protein ACLPV4_18340 [Solirubrobacteraceae bacterium]